jgi:hypothetical protein
MLRPGRRVERESPYVVGIGLTGPSLCASHPAKEELR